MLVKLINCMLPINSVILVMSDSNMLLVASWHFINNEMEIN